MAEVNTDDSGGGKKGKHQKKRAKRSSTRIDMTPMVDLGFLLLTFFMLTTTFSKPQVMELSMPLKQKHPQRDSMNIKASHALTVLLSNHNRVYYYSGVLKPDSTQLDLTDFSKDGIRKILLDKNKSVLDQIAQLDVQHKNKTIADSTYDRLKDKIQSGKKALFVLVKTDSSAKYRNVVDMLDELNITSVGKYALEDIFPQEVSLMKKYNSDHNIQ